MSFDFPILTRVDVGYPPPRPSLRQIVDALDVLYMDEQLTELLD
jgi:hypothetical protein